MALLIFFTASCTRTVPREPLEKRTFQVDWDALDSRRTLVNGLAVDSIVLTPAQWPLEASVKRLFQLDFIGVFSDLDLTFRSGNLRSDVLRKLYGEGFLPAYVRVANHGRRPARFSPGDYAVRVDKERLFHPVPAGELPAKFSEIDWVGTGTAVVLAALFVVLAVAAAKEGKSARFPGRVATPRLAAGAVRAGSEVAVAVAEVAADATAHAAVEAALDAGAESGRRQGRAQPPAPAGAKPAERGLLGGSVLAPGESREGFLFFRVSGTVTDWRQVRMEKL
ncbi:MAG: hypothetical protein V3S29_07115 [bacterium]